MRKSTHKHQVRRPREKVYLLSLVESDLVALRDACVCAFNHSYSVIDAKLYLNLIKNLDSLIY